MSTEAFRPETAEPVGPQGSATLFRRQRVSAATAAEQAALTILCTAVAWYVLAAVIRGRLVFMRSDLNPMMPVRLLATAYYDLVVIIPTTAIFLALTYLSRRSLPRLRLIARLWWGLAGLMVLLDAINVVVLRFLGTPFTYQWLYYSDFLRSLEARNAIADALSWPLLGGMLAVLAVFVACAMMLRAGVAYVLARGLMSYRMFGCSVGIAVVALLPIARWQLEKNAWSYSTVANPVVAFAGSFAGRSGPSIFTIKTPIGPDDFETTAARLSHAPAAGTPMTGKGAGANVKNVLLFVFESLPAEYVDIYGSPYHATPVLDGLRGQSLVLTNAYAHTPATNASLVSILTGTYPWVSSQFVTQAYPALPLHSLSAILKENGARTAFFNAADLHFKSADKFLEHRGFDVLRDDRSIPCDKPLNRAGSKGTLLSAAWDGDNVDDGCVADALIAWIKQDESRPFFAMTWTMMTHFPYFSPEPERDYGTDNERLNRYLNGLSAGDAALGKIVHALDETGQLDSTLIVICGDHGEAFGRHGQYVHASKIYEENVHIPLLLVNRRLFKGETISTVAGQVDIAPTVLDLLGLPQPGDWQGRSLFAADRTSRTYFFAPWADLLFGYREGDRKSIFNATSGQYEVYDLKNDPHETRNLIDRMPGAKEQILERMAAWVQYQDSMIQKLASSAVAAN